MLHLGIQAGIGKESNLAGLEENLPDYAHFIFRFILFAVLHSLCATNWFKRLFGKREPGYYRLVYNIVSLMMFAWVMTAFHSSDVLYVIPGIWSLVMYGVQLVLLLMMADCLRRTGMASFLGLPAAMAQPQRLVTSGYYAVVRHPLYTLAIVFLFLNPVMTVPWLSLALLSSAYFCIGALIEEQRLTEAYGDAYRLYRQAVPFLIPRLFHSRHCSRSRFQPDTHITDATER